MSEKKRSRYQDIPREKIPWYPTIDYDKCVSCGNCAEFCHNEVYEMEDGEPKVANPYGCVVGCTGCQSQCDEGAISFPDMREFSELLKRIKAEHASGKKA